VAALLHLLINKHGQKGDRHFNKCRAYPNLSTRTFLVHEPCDGNVPQVLFVAKITMAKWLTETGFVFLLHKLVFHL